MPLARKSAPTASRQRQRPALRRQLPESTGRLGVPARSGRGTARLKPGSCSGTHLAPTRRPSAHWSHRHSYLPRTCRFVYFFDTHRIAAWTDRTGRGAPCTSYSRLWLSVRTFFSPWEQLVSPCLSGRAVATAAGDLHIFPPAWDDDFTQCQSCASQPYKLLLPSWRQASLLGDTEDCHVPTMVFQVRLPQWAQGLKCAEGRVWMGAEATLGALDLFGASAWILVP